MLLLSLVVVALFVLDSCTKSNDPEPMPVVGAWKLDRIRTSGFTGGFASFNGDNDPAIFDYQDSFNVKADKTFTGTIRTSGRVIDYKGNWEFTNNELSLKDEKGNEDKYTLDNTATPAQLLSKAVAQRDSLRNPTTGRVELVNYSLRLVYTKQ
ncbi:hypothetical protein GCM10023187_42130 [Nibrella viscosa]|uniref:Lipocalin-like domain-containing protein n=1 Tax=Nibrella viscosa TaxID=1084524 RepID=A0ABP8KRI9_9BACT